MAFDIWSRSPAIPLQENSICMQSRKFPIISMVWSTDSGNLHFMTKTRNFPNRLFYFLFLFVLIKSADATLNFAFHRRHKCVRCFLIWFAVFYYKVQRILKLSFANMPFGRNVSFFLCSVQCLQFPQLFSSFIFFGLIECICFALLHFAVSVFCIT